MALASVPLRAAAIGMLRPQSTGLYAVPSEKVTYAQASTDFPDRISQHSVSTLLLSEASI